MVGPQPHVTEASVPRHGSDEEAALRPGGERPGLQQRPHPGPSHRLLRHGPGPVDTLRLQSSHRWADWWGQAIITQLTVNNWLGCMIVLFPANNSSTTNSECHIIIADFTSVSKMRSLVTLTGWIWSWIQEIKLKKRLITSAVTKLSVKILYL